MMLDCTREKAQETGLGQVEWRMPQIRVVLLLRLAAAEGLV